MCGADVSSGSAPPPPAGSPPRVRSRRDVTRQVVQDWGITSACAEQTVTTALGPFSLRDHLRVCGADGGSDDGMHAG